jgi:hypothetical protein
MVLHQNCIFSSVIIQDAALSAGTHYYAELAASFPNSFAAGGSGSLTVQPYGAPPAFPPAIITQPSSATMLAGSFAQLSATASGPPTWYQWQKGTNGVYVNATEVGDVTGSRSNVLTFSALAYSDGADYRLIVTNSAGAATSQVATVTVLAPLAVAAVNPAAGEWTAGLYGQSCGRRRFQLHVHLHAARARDDCDRLGRGTEHYRSGGNPIQSHSPRFHLELYSD